MLFSASFAFAVLVAPFVSAQSLSEFPPCAQTCNKIVARVKPCDFDDLNCICRDPTYLEPLAKCESGICDTDSLRKAGSLGAQKCAPVGINTAPLDVTQPQDILDADDVYPKCAQDCLSSASAATGVEVEDYKSLCLNNNSIVSTLQPCLKANCSQADFVQANAFGAQLCSFVPGSEGYGNPFINRTNYVSESIFDQVLCSQPSVAEAVLNSTCKPDDYACICRAPSVLNTDLDNSEREDCDSFDFLLLITQTFQACKNAGVILSLSNVSIVSNITASGTVNGTVSIVNGTIVNGTTSTTAGTSPAQFTGAAGILSHSWEAAGVVAVVGIATLWL